MDEYSPSPFSPLSLCSESACTVTLGIKQLGEISSLGGCVRYLQMMCRFLRFFHLQTQYFHWVAEGMQTCSSAYIFFRSLCCVQSLSARSGESTGRYLKHSVYGSSRQARHVRITSLASGLMLQMNDVQLYLRGDSGAALQAGYIVPGAQSASTLSLLTSEHRHRFPSLSARKRYAACNFQTVCRYLLPSRKKYDR